MKLVMTLRARDESDLLDAQIAPGWPCEYWDRAAMEWTINAIASGRFGEGWGMWYFVSLPPHALRRTLIGNGGFKGPPGDDDGIVEIGYSIVPACRRRGYATEACRGLIAWALRDGRVRMVTAETFPNLKPSIGVMKKLGMRFLGRGSKVIRYGMTRDEFEAVPDAQARSIPPATPQRSRPRG